MKDIDNLILNVFILAGAFSAICISIVFIMMIFDKPDFCIPARNDAQMLNGYETI